MEGINGSSYLILLLIAHELLEPLEYFVVPLERILGIDNPVILIREVEEPTGNATSVSKCQLMYLWVWVEEGTHCCRAWKAPILSVSGRR